ncbi:cytochrome P450 [Ilumatobacter coccineus]|jgi:cytochrome P450|uniref:Cytochrome P450 n=1 Tax=Ilumatobacter coccineus (strain NBRC 103263 / KCTC 29153 / YM16-304) TaxID=1313172 RepID=A0A6C7EHC4_ILUCY|nr:cytochrome P450 [Ilumatobacter coccineus]BAN03376.1 cytochrome P450 [Ilumatobacter coccineus YM16-304]
MTDVENVAEDVSLEGFNPFDPATQQCPHQYYAKMRETTPVFQVPGTDIYMVTRHDLVVPILRDTATFSSNFSTAGMSPDKELVEKMKEIMAEGWPPVPTMLTIDPPHHTRFRGTVATYFTPKTMATLREPVTEIVNRLIDELPADGEVFDAVTQLNVPVPIEAIATVLNVPVDMMADFKRWSDDFIAPIGSNPSDERRLEALRGTVEFQHYFAEQLERRRVEPIGDLMSDLVQSRIEADPGDAEKGLDVDDEGKRELTMSEMLSIVSQLLVAGNETTTKALTEGVRLLAEHPDTWAKLRADPAGYAPTVVEEVLRLSTPTQGMFRVVTADTEIDGVPVPKGARLVVMFAAANRDPEVFPDPDAFDPDREGLMKKHLAFGKGIHFCLGAPLSRLEMTIVFEQLGRRLESITLADDNEFMYFPSFMLRGLTGLNVSITRAA